jgi:fatty-acyl-CoA synthase
VGTTVQQLLAARADDDGVAVKYLSTQQSWRDHVAQASTTAAVMLDVLDRQRPPHVATLLGNTPDMLVQLAAAALGGYVLCGLNTTRRGDALLQDIRRADCQVVVVDAAHRTLLDGLDLGGVQVIDAASPLLARLAANRPTLVPRVVTPNDTFMLIFTSGTSGDPKAVQVSHYMVEMSGQSLAELFSITRADTCYLPMPLFHSLAVAGGWAVAISSGAAMAPAAFSAAHFLPDIRGYDATYTTYVGKALAYVLATPEQADDAANPLRVAFGNEATDRDIAEFSRRFGARVWDGFGSTELAVIVRREPGTPAGSIGKGLDGVAIYDSTTGDECPVARFGPSGELINSDEAIGELVNTAGAGMFNGYYNDPDATSARMRGGMYWSGDLAFRDADGWIYLAGRTADWMRVDGENLAAVPIERIMLRNNAISRVAVYAVPDDVVGDAVIAAVILRPGAELSPVEFEEFLTQQRDLSPKAWPRYVRMMTEFPVTATHKVLKRELIRRGTTRGSDTLWVRAARTTNYIATEE